MTFSAADLPSLAGKVAIVTGANTGIGKVTALELARKGAQVILACRSRERTEPVVEEIRRETGNVHVEFMELDLLSLASAQRFADHFLSTGRPLHILVNNAGIMMPMSFEASADGYESQFATNHLSHFLLTIKLLPVLERSAPARVVCVSSMAHQYARNGLPKPLSGINEAKGYGSTKWYGYSKLCNIYFARELARRMKEKGVKVYANTLHPGVIHTELFRQFPKFIQWISWPIQRLFFLRPEQGALTQLYLAASKDVEEQDIQGQYYIPIARPSKTTAAGDDVEAAKELWAYSEQLIRARLGNDAL